MINTTADGERGRNSSNKIILTGYVGGHVMAILSQRENLDLKEAIETDCAALHRLVGNMSQTSNEIHCLRDATRWTGY